MIIDFHTHIFPDRIAAKTIEALEDAGNTKAYTDGTLEGLKKSMSNNGITLSIVLPVVTRPSQFESINAFAAQINGKDGMISFGGIHPDTSDYKKELDTIKTLGLSGIKLHPDYQKSFVDEERMVQIIQYAAELGLIIMLHAGIDIGLPEPVHCSPERVANMLGQIDAIDPKIILAHTGGYGMWDQVEEHIVGKNVWLDISYSLGMIDDVQFVRIVKDHGVDKVLFATDSPWAGQKETYEHFLKLDFSEEERECILARNAQELLGITG